ncbi:MAG: hypothetical protein GY772_20350 [bacterium]|nr:hypothetical protein [bacterium]
MFHELADVQRAAMLDILGFQVEPDEPIEVDLAHAWHHVGEDYSDAVAHGAATAILVGWHRFDRSIMRTGSHLNRVLTEVGADLNDLEGYLSDVRRALVDALPSGTTDREARFTRNFVRWTCQIASNDLLVHRWYPVVGTVDRMVWIDTGDRIRRVLATNLDTRPLRSTK